ncbi:MAG: 4Fe-4S binding protein [Deltaproteobacteria bacterium]|nr:4Fe-4S binding protein [Deltaproteobacteria bacterium]
MNNIVRLIEGFFVRNRERFGYIHAGMFIVFAALIFIPPFLPLPAEDAAIGNNFTLMARFLIWGLWFPLMLLSVVFLGRLWCGLFCPQGALSEYAGKRGLNRPIPRWMRWGWMPVASFIFITTLAQLIGARDYPLAAMEVLGGTMVLATLVGFLYASGRRPWCRYLCPIGPLLGIFSRLGAVSFEKNGGDGRGCVCPTFINTANKVASSNCIECFRCVNPETSNALRLRIRRPGIEIEEIQGKEPNLWEVIFLFAATGLALGAFHWQINPMYIRYKQMLGGFLLNIGLGDFIGRSGPWWIMVNYPSAGDVFNWLDFISITTFMLTSMSAVAIILFILTAISAFILKEKEPVMTTVARLGYLYAPVALVSLILGLGLILFKSLGDLGISKDVVHMVQGFLFAAGGMWSIYLAVRLHNGWSMAVIPNIVGIAVVAAAWQRVLF